MEWSNLPVELLGEVAKKVASIVEFIRFRAVCRSWRSAASSGDLPPQLPWLLLPYYSGSESLPFFCLSTGTIIRLRIPESRNKRICGSGHGWLILFDDYTTIVTLVNPLTGSIISLPPYGTRGGKADMGALSASPTSVSGCIVALSGAHCPLIGFYYLCHDGGSRDWSKFPLDIGIRILFTSIGYNCDKLCVVDRHHSLVIWNTTPQSPLTPPDISVILPSLGEGWTLLHCQVVDSSEEPLLVALFGGLFGNDPLNRRRECYVIYRLDTESQQLNRVDLESIGYNTRWLPICPDQCLVCRKCLYFGRSQVNDWKKTANVVVRVLDLKKGDVEELQFESDYLPGAVRKAVWLVPSLI